VGGALIAGTFTRGPKGEWAFRADEGALHLLRSGDEIRVLHRDGALIYAGHVWFHNDLPLDIPLWFWDRWFDEGYRGEYLP
jgi:hypothetical protein